MREKKQRTAARSIFLDFKKRALTGKSIHGKCLPCIYKGGPALTCQKSFCVWSPGIESQARSLMLLVGCQAARDSAVCLGRFQLGERGRAVKKENINFKATKKDDGLAGSTISYIDTKRLMLFFNQKTQSPSFLSLFVATAVTACFGMLKRVYMMV